MARVQSRWKCHVAGHRFSPLATGWAWRSAFTNGNLTGVCKLGQNVPKERQSIENRMRAEEYTYLYTLNGLLYSIYQISATSHQILTEFLTWLQKIQAYSYTVGHPPSPSLGLAQSPFSFHSRYLTTKQQRR